MKKLFILAIVFISVSSFGLARNSKEKKVKTTGIRQIVLLKFKSQITAGQIASIDSLTVTMAEKIKPVRKLEWGKRVDETGTTKTFDYCLMVEFRDETDMEIYQTNPLHLKFLGKIIPMTEKMLKFTYLIKK